MAFILTTFIWHEIVVKNAYASRPCNDKKIKYLMTFLKKVVATHKNLEILNKNQSSKSQTNL